MVNKKTQMHSLFRLLFVTLRKVKEKTQTNQTNKQQKTKYITYTHIAVAKQTSSSQLTPHDIVRQIHDRQYQPIYLLMGEESYYIDRISEYIADTVLTEAERDFNQTTLYCTRETSVSDIINLARRYPMMAEHQVVIVKEAQNLLKFDDFAIYASNPLQTTILVICYKNGTVDRRKKVLTSIEKSGIVFESKKMKDGQLPGFISDYLRRRKITIDQRAALMLTEAIGADLNRMAGELDKLIITLPEGVRQITPEQVERNTGISREFNNWELRNAILARDPLKANQILRYFEENPKPNPPILTIAMLFNFFSSIMLAYYSPDKSPRGLMQQLDFRNEWQLRDITTGMQRFTAMKTMLIIGKIRESDARLKGIGKGCDTDADVMRDLIYFILH